MDWLRADAVASHSLPWGTHVTTRITGAGAVSSDTNVFHDDSAVVRASKKQLADKKAEGAFYRSDCTYADRKAAQRKRNSEYVASECQKYQRMQKMLLEKSIDQKVHRQEISQQVIEQRYLENYMLGMQPRKSWSI